jgi:hypothetical protein
MRLNPNWGWNMPMTSNGPENDWEDQHHLRSLKSETKKPDKSWIAFHCPRRFAPNEP